MDDKHQTQHQDEIKDEEEYLRSQSEFKRRISELTQEFDEDWTDNTFTVPDILS